MGTQMYRIKIGGQLSPSWSDRLGGMAIATEQHPTMGTVTVLEGPLIDQAALAGVLDALYQLRLKILLVEEIGRYSGTSLS